ncbi:MAG: polyprenyl synthetase family protein [Candidatus Bathyarchaeota archaeon]
MEKVREIFLERGHEAYELAKRTILQEKIENKQIFEALRYFMEELWYDVQHPALLSLTCEAVGGDPDSVIPIAASMALLAGSADLHDDIIDKSKIKGSKSTVLAKFGVETSLLAGDALLLNGLLTLREASMRFPQTQRQKVIELTKKAFHKMSSAEVHELSLRGRFDLTPEEYHPVIEGKAAVAEANARIGAVLGEGNQKEVDALGHFGRSLGVLMTIRDDFIDIFEPDELQNRVKNECLPIPLIYALQNLENKEKILQLLQKEMITNEITDEILDIIMETKEVSELKAKMNLIVLKEKSLLKDIKKCKNLIYLILDSTLEDL